MIRYLPAGAAWNTAIFSTQEGAVTRNHGSITFGEHVTVPAVIEACCERLKQEKKLDLANELELLMKKLGERGR